MTAVTIQEAQARLVDLIRALFPGDELLITDNNQPVARLIGEVAPARRTRRPGSAKGKLVIKAEDEAHLSDFQEYMP